MMSSEAEGAQERERMGMGNREEEEGDVNAGGPAGGPAGAPAGEPAVVPAVSPNVLRLSALSFLFSVVGIIVAMSMQNWATCTGTISSVEWETVYGLERAETRVGSLEATAEYSSCSSEECSRLEEGGGAARRGYIAAVLVFFLVCAPLAVALTSKHPFFQTVPLMDRLHGSTFGLLIYFIPCVIVAVVICAATFEWLAVEPKSNASESTGEPLRDCENGMAIIIAALSFCNLVMTLIALCWALTASMCRRRRRARVQQVRGHQ